MNDGPSSRQQIVEKIKNSTNILVTVSKDPTVDELSAAIGLTSMLNGLKKHTTAVVSGEVPPAITFLEPAKTFENTVDSLRDFIIALDKEKADHLRYKVDGDVVKIFITPYRTTISQDDLDFSQGDYNVELVLALGVKNQDNLDRALEAHGKILHDATVATLSSGESSKLGSIDWTDTNASSLCEMLVSLSEALKNDKPVLNEQVATAFLTGIVAATDRFSNNKTSSKVMTMAAQLMAAGANQQLIAAKLEEAHEIGPDKDDADNESGSGDGSVTLNENESTQLPKEQAAAPAKDADGELSIAHEKQGTLEEVAQQTAAENQAEAAKTAEEELATQLSKVAPAAATPSVADMQKDLAAASNDVAEAAAAPESILPPVAQLPEDGEPSLGGTLNATTEQAQQDKQHEIEADRNKTILTHNGGSYVGDQTPSFQSPFNAASDEESEPPSVDIFGGADQTMKAPEVAPAVEAESPAQPEAPAPEPAPSLPPVETLADIDRSHRQVVDDHAEARSAIELAYEATPLPPSTTPVQQAVQEVSAPAPELPPEMTPPLPPSNVDLSQLPPPPPPPNFAAPQGPVAPEHLEQLFNTPPATPPVTPPAPNDPGQFKIPGQ